MNERFAQCRKQLLRYLTDTQVTLDAPDGPYDDGLWRLGFHDTINALHVQVSLIDQIISDNAQQTNEGLMNLLRSLFARCDEVNKQIAMLPNFDHVDSDDVSNLSEDEREVYDEMQALYHELFVNQHQYLLIGDLLAIDPRRIHDVVCIIGAHHDAHRHTRPEAAYYPMIKSWIEHGGDVTTLSIPKEFSEWMSVEAHHG